VPLLLVPLLMMETQHQSQETRRWWKHQEMMETQHQSQETAALNNAAGMNCSSPGNTPLSRPPFLPYRGRLRRRVSRYFVSVIHERFYCICLPTHAKCFQLLSTKVWNLVANSSFKINFRNIHKTKKRGCRKEHSQFRSHWFYERYDFSDHFDD